MSSQGVPQTSINADEVLIKIKTKVNCQITVWFTSAKSPSDLPLFPPPHLIKVCKERIRVLEFMRDYDKLRSGRISLTSFRRALDLCGFELSQPEVAALEKRLVYLE